jgi:hypothetical protein
VNDHDDSIDERDRDNMGVDCHGNKNSSSNPEFFLVTTILQVLKTHRLIGGQGDGCLVVVALNTIQRQANLNNKGMYDNKTMSKSSYKFSSPKQQQIFVQKLMKQINKQNPSSIFFSSQKTILPNFVVELPGLNIISNWVLQD